MCNDSIFAFMVLCAQAGFALPIAIVAKCEEIINLAQKILIWRQLLAKEKSQVILFVWRRNRHLWLQVIASCRLMVILIVN